MSSKRTIDNSIGLAIRRFRELKGLSQAALADDVGVTQVAISQIENGKRINNLDALRRIAAALGMKLSVLIAHSERTKEEILRDNGRILAEI